MRAACPRATRVPFGRYAAALPLGAHVEYAEAGKLARKTSLYAGFEGKGKGNGNGDGDLGAASEA